MSQNVMIDSEILELSQNVTIDIIVQEQFQNGTYLALIFKLPFSTVFTSDSFKFEKKKSQRINCSFFAV